MALYDWPAPPSQDDDRLALRNTHYARLWRSVAAGYAEGAAAQVNAQLAAVANSGITDAQIDARRWLPIGPSAIVGGQAGGAPEVAGRVRDIRRSPDGARIYLATAGGGVWFSGDAGRSWGPLGFMATTPAANAAARVPISPVIGCLHVEFGANADADVVYAGTGEPPHDVNEVGLPATAGGGIGILKLSATVSAALADPNGAHWQREAPNLSGAGIYRIVRNPTDPNMLVAATTFGLFSRSGAFAANAAWTRVAAAPFAGAIEDRLVATDAVWVPAATAPSAAPARLFVALVNLGKQAAQSGLYVSEAGLAGPFTPVTLAGYANKNRIALAAVMPAAAAPGNHPQIVYVLSSADDEPRLWRVAGKNNVNRVAKVPPTLFGGDREVDGEQVHTTAQPWHNMAIAVGPNDPAVVYLAGGAEMGSLGWSAALYRCVISGSAAADDFKTDFQSDDKPREDAAFIGENVPADLHALRLSDDGQTLWIGGDGGAFVSMSGGVPGSIQPRNDGLATAECGYIASHPGHAGAVVASAHGTGVLQRIGDTVWRREPWGGDAGGLAYHPQAKREAFFAAQRTRTSWHADGRFDAPVARAGFKKTRISPENKRALFYSSPAVAVGAAAGKARLAVGTYRVWITDDWDPLAPTSAMTWRTLPSATDPLAGKGPDFKKDCVDDSIGSVVAIRWLDPGTLSGSAFVGGKLIALYEKAVVRLQQDSAGKWTRDILAWSKKSRLTENSDIPANGAPSEKLPMFAAWTAIAPHRATKSGDAAFKGSFYVTMSGHSARTSSGITESDRLDTLWWFDGKKDFYPTGFRANGSKAPAFAVVCDPENPDTVYVGGAAGVWKGVINTAGAAPAWNFEPFGFGLPEAPVHDLTVHWDASAPNGGVKLLRAATRARGVWEVDVSANPASVGRAYLRVHDVDTRRVLPTRLVNLSSEVASPPDYSRCLSPDIAVINKVPEFWSNGVPTEADLATLPDTLTTIGKLDARFPAQQVIADKHKAFVLAHYRHVKSAVANDVKIVLLKRRITEAEGDGAGIALSTAWKDAVAKLLVSSQSATLDDRWKRADAVESSNPATNAVTVANTVRAIAGPIDARTPRPAVFNLDLAAATLKQRYLLLAVMTSAKDPLTRAELDQPTVGDLVLNSRHVCARMFVVASTSALFQHVLLDHFDSGSVVSGTVPATPTTQATPFYDATLPGTRSDTTLQGKLDSLLNEARFRSLKKRIGVSLVDLTGANKFAPKYAGFSDRKNFYAASTGKISGLLAAYQLKADATDILAHNPGIDSLNKLADALSAAWKQAGIPQRHHPLVKAVLTFNAGAPEPIGLQPDLLTRFAAISHGNSNGSTAIILMRFPYIGSTLLAHGLFSPLDKSGLWCWTSYGAVIYLEKEMAIAPWASNENPYPSVPSNCVNAVAAAQYLTLAAQGRLIDRKTSTAILGHLHTGACLVTDFMTHRPNLSAKCGIYGGFNNEVVYFREPAGREMVVVVLSEDVSESSLNTLVTAITALV